MPIKAVFHDPSASDVRRPGDGEPRQEEGLQSDLHQMIDEALQWREEHLDPEQAEATKFYMGEPFGNEEKGRSAVVMTVVRDVVRALLPSLMRIFFGSNRVVEYMPKGLEDVELAEQQTDYINHIVIQQDNRGFETTWAVFKDALVRKQGVVKWWWESKESVEERHLTGVPYDEVEALAVDDEVESFEIEDSELVEIPNQVPRWSFDVRIKVRNNEGRARFEAVPPEEFIFTPDARDIDQAPMVGHVRLVPATELIARGFDRATVERYAEAHARRGDNQQGTDGELWNARRVDKGANQDEEQGRGGDLVPFGELYVRYDRDNDGIAEMLRCYVIGRTHHLLEEPTVVDDERPFALYCPDPEPHTIVGLSMADYTNDLQRIFSAIVRGVLDSLTLTLHPKTEVDINRVEIEDVLSETMGGVIRSDGINNINPISHEFVGAAAMPVLDYFTQVKEDRTGVSKAAAGLAPDALQSSTRAAVAATVEGARQHIEIIARIFAETGMKRLYRGLYKLVKENQDYARTVRLRGKFVEVDPRDWDAEMDVVVNVALGGPTNEEKLQFLQAIAADQQQHLMMGSPLVTMKHLRHTLATAVEAAGFRNPDAFYAPWGEEEQRKFEEQQAQQAQQQTQSDPEMALVEVERERVQAEIQLNQQKAAQEMQLKHLEIQMKQAEMKAKYGIEAGKLELEQQKAAAEDDRKRDELAQDFAIDQAQIEAKHDVELRDAELRADVAQGNQQQEGNDD